MEKLKISENNRYFVHADNTPFTWLADTVWTMPQRIKWDDVEYYMKTRKDQGFTVLQIVALDPEQDVEMRNPAGEKALLNNDLNTPNEKYFEYLDWILDRAESYGFYVLLLPVWGQLVVGCNWMGQTFDKTVTEENAYRYGQWIGHRYKDRNNILWCLGGDRQPIHLGVDYKNVWRRMAEGLAKGVLDKDLKYDQKDPAWNELPLTYHACHEAETGECSTMSYWTDDEAWIRYIMLQSGHGAAPKNYELVEKEYRRARTMPVWDGEPAYELMPTMWPIDENTPFHGSWMVRRRAYWALFSGAFGHTYGHGCVWCSISEKERSDFNPCTWYEALHYEGAEQIRYIRALLDNLQIMTYQPVWEICPEMPNDKMDLHIQACGSPDRKTLCVYFPGGGTATLKLDAFWDAPHKKVYLWWYNPRDGKFYKDEQTTTDQPESVGLSGADLTVSAPSAGEEKDWVLLVMTEQTGIPVKVKCCSQQEEVREIRKVFEW